MSIEKHKALIDSLDGGEGLPDEMHAWRFDEPLQPFDITMFMLRDGEGVSKSAVAYLVERIRRAESRQIPDLKERVKELVRDAMDAQNKYDNGYLEESTMHFGEHERLGKIVEEFRTLCGQR